MDKKYLAALGVAAVAVFAVPHSADAACSFTRNLDVGAEGEDVRCLQQYLNGAGFTVAASGVGSPGRETTQFKDLTKQAVAKWQASHGLTPAIGYFGPLSRQKYNEVSGEVAGVSTNSGTGSVDVSLIGKLTSQIATLTAELNAAKAGGTGDNADARAEIVRALDMIADADDQLDEGEGDDLDRAEKDLEDAEDDIFEAMAAYFDGDFDDAKTLATKAYDNAADAFERAGGEDDEDEVEELIEEVEDDLKNAEDEIDAADDDGEDVDKAEELLEKAEDVLDQAKDALKDDDFKEAEELAKDAEDLIEDALDAIGENDEADEAEDAIDDAQDAINDARERIEEADDDGDDVDDAQDLLDEAEDTLDDAQDAYDDDDYDEAIDLANDAEDLANEAIDEL